MSSDDRRRTQAEWLRSDDGLAPLERAALSARRLAGELADNREELVQLMIVRSCRAWTAQEFERYLVLSRVDARLRRSYLAALRTFDHVRQRPREPLAR